ncbi:MAG TPA: hypothetical protein VF881_17595 [Polyangiaceae bacterium]
MTTSDDQTPSSSSIEVRLEPEVSVQLEALRAVLEQTDDPAERARVLIEIAIKVRDGLRDRSQALATLLQAWQADPTNGEVLDHLEPLTRSLNQWQQVLETTRTLLANERTPARMLAYAEAMVGWLTREVAMPEHALEYLERVRRFDSTHWLVRLFQAANYEQRGDLKSELEELDRAVVSAKRAQDRARIHVLMASRYADPRVANSAEAKRHFLAAQALVPTSMEALAGLEQIFRGEGDLPALAEVLEKQVEATEVEAEQVQILLRLAELYERQFVKPEMAAEKLERAFALDPTDNRVLAALERCYTSMRSWDDLVRVLEGAIFLVEDPQERAERLVNLAEIFESKLGDPAGALKAYERLEKLLPDDETLVGELARLSEKIGDWQAAVRYRTKLTELAPDARTRARMHVMAGQLLLPHDAAAARAHFEQAVTFDPPNAAAWNALLAEARKSGDMARVATYLEQRAVSSEAPRAQAQSYAELGTVRQSLGDGAGALAAWESAISADPNNETAAAALLEEYVGLERWQDAARLSDRVVHAAERGGDLERLFMARLHASLVAVHSGQPGRALTMALGAFHIHPDDLDVRQTLVECAWTMRADPQVLDAMEALGMVADMPPTLGTLPPDSRAQLGEIFALTGERDRAMVIFDTVLAEQPGNGPALRGLSSLRAARGESIAAWSLKRQLAETIADPEERFQILMETGEGFATKANRPDLAVEVYEQARAIRPNDRPLLHKLLAEYQTLEDWPKVCGVLRAIADSDQEPTRKAKVLMTIGQIAHAKLEDRATAVALYDEALEVDPSRLEAFERIVRLLTEVKDWSALERMYRRMIARALGGSDARLQHALYHQLGLIYRDRLHDRESALATFRMAVQLQPDDEQGQAILRELLAMSGQGEGAVALTLERVRRDPLDPGSYPALYDLLARLGHTDRAWVIASIMAYVVPSYAPAAAFRHATPPPPFERITGTLGADGYRRLLHPELDPTLTAIFEIMAAAAVEVRLAQLGFREKLAYPGPPLTQPEFLLQDVKSASRILGLPEPRVFSARVPPAIGVGVTRPPSLLVHPESLPGFPRNLLAFWIGKRLAELTPPLLARALFRSVSELKDLVTAAARIVQDTRDKDNRSDEMWRTHIRKDAYRKLSSAVERAVAAGALDVRRWSQLADLSTSRAGLVIAGDVDSARLALVREGQSPGDLTVSDQMRELVAFFLSEDYAHMRAVLGVTLK